MEARVARLTKRTAPPFAALITGTFALALPLSGARAQQNTGSSPCNAPTTEPIVHVALPGNPFTPVISSDGCWVFVALAGQAPASTPGVAVIKRGAGKLTLKRTVPLKAGGTGAVLTHDGKMLIVAAGSNIAFLDAAKLVSGAPSAVMGYLEVGEGTGAIYANVTKNDALLFVALERTESILVIDLAKLRRSGSFDSTVVLGRIPVGNAPIAVTLSNKDKYLYATSQSQAQINGSWNWPLECAPENPNAPLYAAKRSKGAVLVVDVARARKDAEHAVLAKVPVGCGPVRLVLSPDESTAWVTVRGEHSIVAVDTKKMLADPANAVIMKMKVGTAPVGVAVVDGGKKVIATNSNRFAGGADDKQSLNVIDISNGAAKASLLGLIPAGAFPRELRITPDGKTLFASNFASKTLQVVDLSRLVLQKSAP